jgi:hypothetical protein
MYLNATPDTRTSKSGNAAQALGGAADYSMRSGLSDTVGHERVSILSAIRIAVALIAFSRAKQIGCSLSSSASKSQSPTMIARSLFRSCASVQRSATKGQRIVFFQLGTTARPNSRSSAFRSDKCDLGFCPEYVILTTSQCDATSGSCLGPQCNCRNQALAQLCAFHSPSTGLMSEIDFSTTSFPRAPFACSPKQLALELVLR